MAPPVDVLTGRRFGRLTVMGRAPSAAYGATRWFCRCDCGGETVAGASHLKRGTSTSCGCFSRELSARRLTTHGGSRTDLYAIWANIKDRCLNPRHRFFKHYGGRGISICDRWLNSFEAFKEDVGPRPSPQHSIDRQDNDGPYAPWNVRWATAAEQAKNRRPARRANTVENAHV